jgi:hypothetical protein
MPLFRDLEGNFFDIPVEDLPKYRVEGEVPEGAKLAGGEVEGSQHPSEYHYHVPGAAAYNYPGPDRAAAYNWERGAAPAPGYNYQAPGAAAYSYSV